MTERGCCLTAGGTCKHDICPDRGSYRSRVNYITRRPLYVIGARNEKSFSRNTLRASYMRARYVTAVVNHGHLRVRPSLSLSYRSRAFGPISHGRGIRRYETDRNNWPLLACSRIENAGSPGPYGTEIGRVEKLRNILGRPFVFRCFARQPSANVITRRFIRGIRFIRNADDVPVGFRP